MVAEGLTEGQGDDDADGAGPASRPAAPVDDLVHEDPEDEEI
jgi:hypothetical protein